MSRHLLLTALAACAPSVPEAPSFQTDVMPIFASSCLRCHGAPALGGAPPELRLDSFGDLAEVSPEDPLAELPIRGAAAYAFPISLRVRDPDSPMPPRFPLDDWQLELLERWADAPERGAPRPGNRPPVLAIEGVVPRAGKLAIRARVSDPDDDVVAGTLRVIAGGEMRLVGTVRSGVVELAWDPAGLAPGAYPLRAQLDDGAELIELDAGMLEVAP